MGVQIDIDVDDLVDDVAQLLDDQQHGAGGVWWNDTDETFQRLHGWESQEAFRAAYRELARELLALVTPAVTSRTVVALQGQLLPQISEIRARLTAGEPL